MPDYLLSTTTAQGQRVVQRVTAPSAETAMNQMREQGFTDIELHNDDVTSWLQAPPDAREGIRTHVSPRLELELATAGRVRTAVILMVEAYRKTAMFMLLILAVFIWRRAAGSPWIWIDYLDLIALLYPVIVALLVTRPSAAYMEMQRAVVEARWHDVLRLIPAVQPQLSKLGSPGRLEAVCWHAKAVAALGRREEALAEMSAFADRPGVSAGVYLTRLAGIHDTARDYNAARRCYEAATQVSPHEPSVWLGFAELLAVRLQCPAEARDALQRVKSFELGAQSQAGIRLVEGAIALTERRFQNARDLLQAFHGHVAKMVAQSPLAIAVQRNTEALLAMACAGMGDHESARAYFAEAAPFLRLHKDEDLLRRCEDALKEMPDQSR